MNRPWCQHCISVGHLATAMPMPAETISNRTRTSPIRKRRMGETRASRDTHRVPARYAAATS